MVNKGYCHHIIIQERIKNEFKYSFTTDFYHSFLPLIFIFLHVWPFFPIQVSVLRVYMDYTLIFGKDWGSLQLSTIMPFLYTICHNAINYNTGIHKTYDMSYFWNGFYFDLIKHYIYCSEIIEKNTTNI
jgi:hypothetical protein